MCLLSSVAAALTRLHGVHEGWERTEPLDWTAFTAFIGVALVSAGSLVVLVEAGSPEVELITRLLIVTAAAFQCVFWSETSTHRSAIAFSLTAGLGEAVSDG